MNKFLIRFGLIVAIVGLGVNWSHAAGATGKRVEMYMYKGLSAHAYMVGYSGEGGCIETSVSVYIDQNRGGGRMASASVFIDKADICDDEEYTVLESIYGWTDVDVSAIASNLGSATMHQSLDGWAYVPGQVDDDEDFEATPVDVRIEMDLTALAGPARNEHWNDSYKNECFSSKYRYNGVRREARQSLSVTVNGEEMVMDVVYDHASISRIRSGSLVKVVDEACYEEGKG